jgi:hypothetical protein
MRSYPGTVRRVVVSLVIVAAFCCVPVILLFQNVRNSAGIQELARPASLSPSSNGDYGEPKKIYSPHGVSDVCVTFEFLGLDPTTALANFGILVGLTGDGLKYVSSPLRRNGSLSLVIDSAIGLNNIAIPVPLSALENSPVTACQPNRNKILQTVGFRTLQDFFVLGEPQAFPDDWYEASNNVAVYLCPSGSVPGPCAAKIQIGEQITRGLQSLPVSLIVMTRAADLSMTVNTDSTHRTASVLEFTARRPTWVVVYTYWVAAMPFVLMIALFTAYARKKKPSGPDRKLPAVYEVAFGVAATLVAILPLRAVLVPSSLPSLTRLDIVFSTGVTLLVALSITWVFVWAKPAENRT